MKNPAAVALGKLGGVGGTGKAKARTSEQARAAVAVRWAKTKRKPKRAARLPNIPSSATPQAGLEPRKRNGGEQ
jgi:hypothetical protein